MAIAYQTRVSTPRAQDAGQSPRQDAVISSQGAETVRAHPTKRLSLCSCAPCSGASAPSVMLALAILLFTAVERLLCVWHRPRGRHDRHWAQECKGCDAARAQWPSLTLDVPAQPVTGSSAVVWHKPRSWSGVGNARLGSQTGLQSAQGCNGGRRVTLAPGLGLTRVNTLHPDSQI